jgi:hypothetical protein
LLPEGIFYFLFVCACAELQMCWLECTRCGGAHA